MTVKNDDLVRVRNLADHTVGYISFDGKFRRLNGQQSINVTAEELRQLKLDRGGNVLLMDYLTIDNKELALELGIDPEIVDYEYTWTKDDVKNLLENGSLDEIADALDFAPEAIVDMIVNEAVAMKLPDLTKRDYIAKATGVNINAKITVSQAIASDAPVQEEKKKTRRVKKEAPKEPTRRVAKKTEPEVAAEDESLFGEE